jgi:hypothetical protein
MCWIDDLTNAQVTGDPFPLGNILKDSVYYPACAVDGSLVGLLGGYFRSFVYVDYAYPREYVRAEMFRHCAQDRPGQNPPSQGFRGYQVFAWRDLSQDDLAPGGWQPSVAPPPALMAMPGHAIHGEAYRDAMAHPFAFWVVYQRLDGYDETHGPERFSLVYLRAEGAAAYDALYHGRGIAPACVALVNPGAGFGGNWDDFENPDGFFGRLVLGSEKVPRFFFDYALRKADPPDWPKYSELVQEWPERRKRLWRLPG